MFIAWWSGISVCVCISNETIQNLTRKRGIWRIVTGEFSDFNFSFPPPSSPPHLHAKQNKKQDVSRQKTSVAQKDDDDDVPKNTFLFFLFLFLSHMMVVFLDIPYNILFLHCFTLLPYGRPSIPSSTLIVHASISWTFHCTLLRD